MLAALCVLSGAVGAARPAAAQGSSSRAAARTRVEGVAAWVGESARGVGPVAILRSDVELRARLGIAGRTGRASMARLPAPLLAAALDSIVGEVLIEREADRLRAARPSEADVRRSREEVDRAGGGPGVVQQQLALLGASSEELDIVARRRAYVEAFLHANLEGNTVISDAQVERAFETAEHPFVGRELAAVRDLLRVWLAQRVLSRDVARWIEVLRGRTTVRILAEWHERG